MGHDIPKRVTKLNAKVNNILSLLVNSVYTKKEFAIRELISNASDALDKLKHNYNDLKSKNAKLDAIADLKITVKAEPFDNPTHLIIQDNGVGMTEKELDDFLGTIASSGTQAFKTLLDEKAQSNNLIGQFGVGFYSAYLIAEEVLVVTKSAEGKAICWESIAGEDEYSVYESEEAEFNHGTKVVLKLAEKHKWIAKSEELKKIIKENSLFIAYPIYLREYEEVKQEEENVNKKERVQKMTHLNKDKPLWGRKPDSISKKEYVDFYKTISNDWQDFLTLKHSSLEGTINFDILIFCPKKNRANLFSDKPKKNNIKLYCQNVFVTDKLGDCLPDWVFVTGVVHFPDLPINISREVIQGQKTYKLIKKIVAKKTLEMVTEMDESQFEEFSKEFGNSIKLAVRDDDQGNSEKYARFLRYESNRSEGKKIGLDEYISKLDGEKEILVLTGTTREEVINSPFLESYKDKHVLYLPEAIDEIMLQTFKKYKDHKITRITTKKEVEIPDTLKEEFKPLTEKLKEILKIESVTLRTDLVSERPCLIPTSEYGLSPAMENIMKSQPGAEPNPFVQMMSMTKRQLEINPNNEIIRKLKFELERNSDITSDSELLYQTALISCGYGVGDRDKYAREVYKRML